MLRQTTATVPAVLAGHPPQPQAAGEDKADIGRDSVTARGDGSQADAGGRSGRD